MSRVSMAGQNNTEILERFNGQDKKAERSENDKAKKEDKGAVFAGDLNLMQDPVTQKREEAQKRAMKLVQDAWDVDRAIDKNVQERRDHYSKMRDLKSEATDELMSVEQDKQAIKEFYEIEDDSKEQQDLELLCKDVDIKNGVSDSSLTMEELERIAQIEKEGLTEYQQRGLELHKRASHFKREIREAEKQMKDDQANIRSIQLERLKKNPMLAAQYDAEKMLENASKEIIGMLQEEAVDHIDEVKEEAEEKAEETTEEKKEEKEKLDEAKLERAEREAMMLGTKEAIEKARAEERKSEAPDMDVENMVDIAKSYNHSEGVKQTLEDIKVNMKLLDADLKGIQVDEGL